MINKLVSGVKQTPRVATASVKLIWKRLPFIALYSLAIAILLASGQYFLIQYDKSQIAKQPGSDFISYTSFTVNNAREGEDITFTLCREHDSNYEVKGTRTVYVIPEGKTEAQKVFIYNKQVQGVVDEGNCQPYFIKESEYHFRPGKYLITLNLNFKVKYDLPKDVFVKSGVFTVYAQPNGGGDVQTQLNNLQERFNDLLDQFNGLQQRQGVSPTAQGSGRSEATPVTPLAPNTTNPAINTNPGQAANPNTGNGNNTPPPAQTCTVDLLGIKLLCT